MNGKIVKYFSRRGFGFITPENSQNEIFFHVSNFPEEAQPEIGQSVGFELIETPKGNEAKNITVLGGEPEDKPTQVESTEEEIPEEAVPEASSLGIGDIKGVGKATAEKLMGAGFETLELIASADAGTLSEKTGISAKVAAKIIESTKELI
ncbi:MAG: cold shock domain-containing protein [Candidatus Bathyarchaeota archaeon]|jgi:cold shock CspA family protein|nr:cold shock domain-containing protein [Candidatus Bathyarchaeota archaeon]